jgi:hypothetical protein
MLCLVQPESASSFVSTTITFLANPPHSRTPHPCPPAKWADARSVDCNLTNLRPASHCCRCEAGRADNDERVSLSTSISKRAVPPWLSSTPHNDPVGRVAASAVPSHFRTMAHHLVKELSTPLESSALKRALLDDLETDVSRSAVDGACGRSLDASTANRRDARVQSRWTGYNGP